MAHHSPGVCARGLASIRPARTQRSANDRLHASKVSGTMPAIYNAVEWSSQAGLRRGKTAMLGNRPGHRRMIRAEMGEHVFLSLGRLTGWRCCSHSSVLLPLPREAPVLGIPPIGSIGSPDILRPGL